MRGMRVWLAVLTILVPFAVAQAHELRPGYLELRQVGAETYDVVWKLPVRGNRQLALRVGLPEACQATSQTRRAGTAGAVIERRRVRCPGGLEGQAIEIDGLNASLTDVLVRLERGDGTTQTVRLTPDSRSFVVAASPSRLQVAATYFVLGVEHILLGVDHLLFVLALLLLVKGGWMLVKTITAFTVAHSITLALAALGHVHVPQAPVEAVIALSIVFLASELAKKGTGAPRLTESIPWLVAFVFGLLHGFGFAGALTEIGLPRSEIPLALLTFNIGVEVGQLLFVGAVLAAVAILGRLTDLRISWGRQATAYGIGCISAFWLIERLSDFG